MIWMAVIVLIAIYGYICWRSVENGLLVLLGALPLYLVRLECLGMPTTLLELMFVVVFLFWLKQILVIAPRPPSEGGGRHEATSISVKPASSLTRLLRRFTSRNDYRLFLIATITIILGALLGLTQTYNLASSINAIKSFLVEPILVALMIWSVAGNKKLELKKWMLALTIPMALVSIYAIFQYFTGFGIPDAWFLERRVTSIFPYPNALGHFVAPIITLNIVWLMQRGLKRLGASELMITSSTLLGLVAVFLSQTEAAWVAIAVTVVLAGIWIGRHRKTWIAIALLGALLVIAVPQARHKLTLQDWSGQTRTAQWEETWNFLTSSPRTFILGAGANNYPIAVEPFHTHDYLEIFQQPHNIFFNVWVEYGILGLIGMLLLAFELVRLQTTPNPSFARRGISSALPLAAALAEMSIHGLVDVPYFKNDLSILTWTLIILLIIFSRDRQVTASVIKNNPARKG